MIDAAHTLTLAELARVQVERDTLREECWKALGYLEAAIIIERKQQRPVRIEERLVASLKEALGEPGEQDPIADAEEDEAYRAAVANAVARMDAAEAREDAADLAGRKP